MGQNYSLYYMVHVCDGDIICIYIPRKVSSRFIRNEDGASYQPLSSVLLIYDIIDNCFQI